MGRIDEKVYHSAFAASPVTDPTMALPYELLIGLRYTRAKRRNHFISFISGISMLGVALGVAALIVVLSVMNGFQKELRGPHPVGGLAHPDPGGQRRARRLALCRRTGGEAPCGQGGSTVRAGAGHASFNQNVRGAMVRGVLPDLEDKVADFRPHMKSGSFDALVPDSFGIVLGSELARALGVFMGDR